MKEKISVLSSYAKDILMNSNEEILSQQDGGPIMFIKNALDDSGVPYQLNYGERINVEILMTDKGEFGRVREAPSSLMIPNEISNWLIVSTLLKEWDLSGLKDFSGKAFIDIQGYVRNGDDFGKKLIWEEVKKFNQKIYCLKGTKQEVSYLPKSVFDDQKNRLLIITNGEEGVEIFNKNKNFIVKPKEVLNPKDTLGAGDTFFGYFVANLYKGFDVEKAANFAVDKTSEFLNKK